MLDYFKKQAISLAAKTGALDSTIKGHLKEKIEENFATADVELKKVKLMLKKDKHLGQELSDTLFEVETKKQELLTFATADEQLDTLTRIIVSKLGDYASTDALIESLKQSPAIQEMKAFAKKLVSPDIYKKLSLVIENAGNIKDLSKKQQEELVVTLQSDDIAANLEAIDLETALAGFKKSGKKLCKELALDSDDTQDLETIFEDLEREHLESFNKIKSDLQEKLPVILAKVLEYVHKECPRLAISDAPKPITHARAASASKPESKAAPKKKTATLADSDDEKVEVEPVKKKAPPKKAAASSSSSSVKKAPPKRKAVEAVAVDSDDDTPVVVQKKKGPGKK